MPSFVFQSCGINAPTCRKSLLNYIQMSRILWERERRCFVFTNNYDLKWHQRKSTIIHSWKTLVYKCPSTSEQQFLVVVVVVETVLVVISGIPLYSEGGQRAFNWYQNIEVSDTYHHRTFDGSYASKRTPFCTRPNACQRFYLVLVCFVLFCFVLFCFVLFCSVLLCFTQSVNI